MYKTVATIYLGFILFSVVKCEKCDKNVTQLSTGSRVTDAKTFCKTRPCLYRFCDKVDQILLTWLNRTHQCVTMDEIRIITNNTSLNLTAVNRVYKTDDSHENKLSEKTVIKYFSHVKFSEGTNTNCTGDWIKQGKRISFYIQEDGSLLVDLVNMNSRFQNYMMGQFIIEYNIKQLTNGNWTTPLIVMKQLIEGDSKSADISEEIRLLYVAVVMLISCFFLTLLLLVYCICQHLRTLAGIILMAYVATFNVGCFVKAAQCLHRLFAHTFTEDFCRYTSIVSYFSLLSSFFWMNVMSFDIWYTFGKSINARPIHRKGILHKFCMYSLYSYGIPLLITGIAIVLDSIDLSNAKSVVRPGFALCFRDGSQLYFYVPINILIVINFIFCLLTSYNIWKIRRGIANCSESRMNNNNENSFMLFVKLFTITGLNWILEVVTKYVTPPLTVKYILDTYNGLIGVIIFVMFVCKKQILVAIVKRFPCCYCACFSKILDKNNSERLTLSTTVKDSVNRRREASAVQLEILAE